MSAISEIHTARGAKLIVRNGKEVPLSIADRATTHQALRRHCIVVDYSHFAIVDVAGESVFDFLDAIVSGDLAAIRDGQALYTFILDDHGLVVMDLFVMCDDERYVLLTESMSGSDLKAHLESNVRDQSVVITNRDNELTSILFEGPYSWEVAKELFGMDVIGLPFMEHMHVSGGILFRVGNHGEFSYQLICENDVARDLLEDREGVYKKYDAVFAGLDFQELARLENPCWDDVRFGDWSRCPIELQLQWMVRYDKEHFIGKSALESRLAVGPERRMVGFVADVSSEVNISTGQPVYLEGAEVGIVTAVGFSPERKQTIGQALIRAKYAYADISGFKVNENSISTSAIPFVRNYSFIVNPLEHSYVDPKRYKNLIEQMEAKAKAEEAERAEQNAEQKGDESG